MKTLHYCYLMWRICRGVLGSGDVTHFQYDVAEVKLSVRERPEWLESLTASGGG